MRGQVRQSRPDYKAIYNAGVREGFEITNARQYFRNGDGNFPRVEQTTSMPFTWKGMNVIGYTDTDARIDKRSGRFNLYTTDLSELYVESPKDGQLHLLDDEIRPGDPVTLHHNDGREVSQEKVHENLKLFASAATEYPHVFMFDEYMESQSFIAGRFNMSPPKESDYTDTYLPSIERQLMDRQQVFVGAIKSRADMHMAYESAPSVMKDSLDFYASMDHSEDQYDALDDFCG